MVRRSADRELNDWLDRNGYSRARKKKKAKTAHPYAVSMRSAHAARKIESPVTGREVFAARERDGKLTTAGRRALRADQFALPPGPEEKRRGIKGRLPIDESSRARSALARASMMHRRGDLTARQLNAIRHRVNRAFPEIHVSPIED